MNAAANDYSRFRFYQRRALIVAGVGGVVCAIGALAPGLQVDFLRAFLVAWLFWLGISLGCMSLMLVHNLTGGKWGMVMRRVMVAGGATIPLMAVLMLPILFGMKLLYPWANESVVASSHLIQSKTPYLNVEFFLIRQALYFVLWIGVFLITRRLARRVRTVYDERLARRLRMASGFGLFIYGLTITFGSIDWAMSLDPEWFSSIWGVMFMVGQGLAGLCFMVLLSVTLPDPGRLSQIPTRPQLHDLGNLMFGFTMLWAYMSFSQFLIIWYADLPEEVTWYLQRSQHGWQWVAAALMVLHFFLPFLVLLARRVKRSGRMLASVAFGILCMRWIDLLWLTQPSFGRNYVYIPWLDLAATAAIGGLWIFVFLWRLPGTLTLDDYVYLFAEEEHH